MASPASPEPAAIPSPLNVAAPGFGQVFMADGLTLTFSAGDRNVLCVRDGATELTLDLGGRPTAITTLENEVWLALVLSDGSCALERRMITKRNPLTIGAPRTMLRTREVNAVIDMQFGLRPFERTLFLLDGPSSSLRMFDVATSQLATLATAEQHPRMRAARSLIVAPYPSDADTCYTFNKNHPGDCVADKLFTLVDLHSDGSIDRVEGKDR